MHTCLQRILGSSFCSHQCFYIENAVPDIPSSSLNHSNDESGTSPRFRGSPASKEPLKSGEKEAGARFLVDSSQQGRRGPTAMGAMATSPKVSHRDTTAVFSQSQLPFPSGADTLM